MEVFKEPWPHMIIEDFYPQDKFEELQAYAKRKLLEEGFGKNGKFRMRFSKDPELTKILEGYLLSEGDLKDFPEHRDYDELDVYTELQAIIGPYHYKLHVEAPNKVLTQVTYLLPEINRGTRVFDENVDFVTELDWKPNRTLRFCGIDDVTWHDYLCDKGSIRVTINQFLERGDSE